METRKTWELWVWYWACNHEVRAVSKGTVLRVSGKPACWEVTAIVTEKCMDCQLHKYGRCIYIFITTNGHDWKSKRHALTLMSLMATRDSRHRKGNSSFNKSDASYSIDGFLSRMAGPVCLLKLPQLLGFFPCHWDKNTVSGATLWRKAYFNSSHIGEVKAAGVWSSCSHTFTVRRQQGLRAR